MATSLLDWIIDLMRDGSAREVFNANPQAAMTSAGFTNVCGDDVSDSRAFLFDNPAIREIKDAEKDVDDNSDAPDQIKYIVNNYTYEAPSTNPTDPDDLVDIDDEGPEIDQSENDGGTNTATVSEDETTTEANTETETEDGNAVSGDNSAGEDQFTGTFDNIGEGISGDGNINVLTLADVIDIEDSPFLTNVLTDSLDDSLDDLVHNLLGGP